MYDVEVIDTITYVKDYIEVISIILTFNKIRLFISAIYRPPSASALLFNDILFNEIVPNIPPNCSSIVVGDINLNLINPTMTQM